MPSVGSLLDQIAVDLNDAAPGHEFTTWSRDQLLYYLTEACQIIARQKPDLLFQDKLVQLVGRQESYELTERELLNNNSILGQADSSGRVFNRLRPRSDDIREQWPGPACPPSDPFKLREFSIAGDGRTIRLYPNIPPNQKVWLSIRVAVVPDSVDAEVSSEVAAAVIQWVLYRAQSVDGEHNPAIVTMANNHLELFFTLLGVRRPRHAS